MAIRFGLTRERPERNVIHGFSTWNSAAGGRRSCFRTQLVLLSVNWRPLVGVSLALLVAGLVHVGIPGFGARRFGDVQLCAYLCSPASARGSGFEPARRQALELCVDLGCAYWGGSRAGLWLEVSDVFQGHPSATGGSSAPYRRLELNDSGRPSAHPRSAHARSAASSRA